jgi:glyoxylase-like metal-dependent hydrolase (beta-lactamase superfamily II)
MSDSTVDAGHVEVGGPPLTRSTSAATITKVAVGPMNNNAYILRCTRTGRAMLIDAAADDATLLPLVDGVRVLLTTHSHGDHIGALAELASATNATTLAGADDADAITQATGVVIHNKVRDAEIIAVGALDVTIVTLVGHTPGSIAAIFRDPDGSTHLFTGDSLFPGGVGNTRNDPAAFASLMGDVTIKLFAKLPDDTHVYPGHGDDTTIGAERPNLPEWHRRGW